MGVRALPRTYFFLEKDYEVLIHFIGCLTEAVAGSILRGRPMSDIHQFSRDKKQLRDLAAIAFQAECVPLKQFGKKQVWLGSQVEVRFHLGNGWHKKARVYQPMGTAHFEIGSYLVPHYLPRMISYDSPIGRALMGAEVRQIRMVDMGGVDTGGGVMPTDFQLEVLGIQ